MNDNDDTTAPSEDVLPEDQNESPELVNDGAADGADLDLIHDVPEDDDPANTGAVFGFIFGYAGMVLAIDAASSGTNSALTILLPVAMGVVLSLAFHSLKWMRGYSGMAVAGIGLAIAAFTVLTSLYLL